MKSVYNILIFCLGLFAFTSCEYDNYDEPNAMFQGRIMYNNQPLNVANGQVNFELWEPGWQLKAPINVILAQEGTYSANLFNANYKLVFRPNQAPFRMKYNTATASDTILVNVNGNTNLDIEVEPYYIINNPQIAKNGDKINATLGLEQIITGVDAKNIERVSLYLNRTQFVDARPNYNLASSTIAGGDIANMGSISLNVDVPEDKIIRPQSFVYARIGVKLVGIEPLIYSPVQQLEL
ncbi:DUF3823 domain-containing protein [Pontibacter sp. SGAir0037]|uniref:DUF3823 domain-containing protein n=1 Tax=Pontibacter sp. SGAir0037 TaxID=2571030 RepID=UPI0010CD3264|nr:DUF3823 domain-containing protein [Pontibacter sp. SGAir0037]QCR21169.1 hypothetical protein C1N53_01575 [Pontibacter sp. SGAir0037]